MKFAEVLKLGESYLEQYEPSMKVLGRRRYSEHFGAKPLRAHDDDTGPLSEADPKRIQAKIAEVLDQLVEMRGGFVMSEPPLLVATSRAEEGLAKYKDFVLRFTHGSDDTPQHKYHLWVECWFYSPDILHLTETTP